MTEEGADETAEAMSFEAVTEAIRRESTPDTTERQRLEEVATTLRARATAAVTERVPDADVVQVGSTARNTWVSGDRDIDIFVRFPPETDRDTLERVGLEVGHETLPSGHEEYAEHPYVKGTYDGFDIDIVPCFRLERASDIRSAVDRTPFHNRYLDRRLDETLADDSRITKQFLKGIDVYGSDLRTAGFSGYLTELLVLEYGGFRPLLEAAADWHPPVELDPEDHGSASFDDPLVVIDPTDPTRNVAAVCSPANVARLQHYARAMLAEPTLKYFRPADPDPLEPSELETHLERRGATSLAIRFDTPDLVDDQLYPQLYKSLDGIARGLDARGFDVLRKTTMAADTAVLLFDLGVPRRPKIERHEGPPVHVRDHAEGFFAAYVDDDSVYGPFIDGDRYVVERERTCTSALEFLESPRLFDVSLGAHVETALDDGYTVLVDDELTDLLEDFGPALRRYFEPTP
ncbi:CCA tRNA nucleotidyltransferase [Natronosalvus hydrolyticus]